MQQRLGVLQAGGVEARGEPVVYLGEGRACLGFVACGHRELSVIDGNHLHRPGRGGMIGWIT